MSNKLSQTIKDMLFINEESKLKVWSEELMKLANDQDKKHQEISMDILKIQKEMSNINGRHRIEL